MKNIGNDPRSLFNGNHFSSLRAKLEFGEIRACILYVCTDTAIYIARLIIEHPIECFHRLRIVMSPALVARAFRTLTGTGVQLVFTLNNGVFLRQRVVGKRKNQVPREATVVEWCGPFPVGRYNRNWRE